MCGAHEAGGRSAGGPVVVIEDDPAVLGVVCEVLEFEGYDVVPLEQLNPLQHLRAMATPVAFLIDIMLGGTDGIAVADALRRGGFPNTPMVAMSASKHMVAQAQRTGLFQEILNKPFDLDALVDTIARVAGSPPV
jgi:CheY-like chemotaxis protein